MATGMYLAQEHVAALQHLWYGHDHVPGRNDFEYSWKAVKAMAAGDGILSDAERRHLVGKMCAIGTPPDIVEMVLNHDEHADSPERLLEHINVPVEVRAGTGAWITYEGLSVALADGDLAPGELDAVRRAATAMGVRSGLVDELVDFCRREADVRRQRIDLLRSAIPGAEFRFEAR